MKQLGNLARFWDNDAEISRIVHELNFGRYAPQSMGKHSKGGAGQ